MQHTLRLAAAVPPAVAVFPALAAAQGSAAVPPVSQQVDTALRGVVLVGAVVVVLILVAVAVLVYRKVLAPGHDLRRAPEEDTTPRPGAGEALAAAAREEARGNLAAAAQRYGAAGENIRAGECWERLKDLSRAAECFEAAGALDRAAQLHVRSGGSLRAAGIYMRTKNYMEAAKIFRNKGDHLRAAQALELYGNKVAAARSYAEAGNRARAALLLEGEGMYREAAEVYGPLLEGFLVTPANADRWVAYASLLLRAGERAKAEMTCRRVLAAVPGHARAEAGLRAILPEPAAPAAVPAAGAAPGEPVRGEAAAAAPPSPEELASQIEDIDPGAGAPINRVFTLRSMIGAGRMEPRYGMRLWVQVMRSLAELHAANRVLGTLCPEGILVDMENNVRFEQAAACAPDYLAPEVQAGIPPDRQADIYSMGVILFELVTGSLAEFGRRRPAEVRSDVPAWLDELIGRCTEKNITRRFRTTEEISRELVRLKGAGEARA